MLPIVCKSRASFSPLQQGHIVGVGTACIILAVQEHVCCAAAGGWQHACTYSTAGTTDSTKQSAQQVISIENVMQRLVALEHQIHTLSQKVDGASSNRRSGGKPQQKAPTDTQSSSDQQPQNMTQQAAEAMEEAGADAMRQLHPAFTTFLNSGYLESQRQIRDHLMRSEWDHMVRQWALQKGVAEFGRFVVENSHQVPGLEVNWEQMQELYLRPEPHDLEPLADRPKARLLAQAFIQQELIKQQLDVYRSCADSAKQLANVIESGQRTGARTLFGLLRKMLPLPPFLK